MNSRISPLYSLRPETSEISLGKAPIELSSNGKTLTGRGEAALSFQPRFRLSVRGTFSGDDPAILELSVIRDSVQLKYGKGFGLANAMITKFSLTTDPLLEAVAEITPNPQRLLFADGDNPRISSFVFHIVNFPTFLSIDEGSENYVHRSENGGQRLMGEVILLGDQWRIEIQELPGSKAVQEELNERGGYGITHVGKLTRIDGNEFTCDAGEKALQHLYFFLSFARGAWTPPILCAGFNAEKAKVYEDWGIRIGTPWESRNGWFDTHRAGSLAQLYPGFISLILEPGMKAAVTNSLYWYFRSNRGGEGAGIDSGIVLSQAALERLSTSFHHKNNLVAPKKAADLLRETLERLQIPTKIPE